MIMRTDFNDFSFTVFIGGNLADFRNAICDIYKDEIINDYFFIIDDNFSVQDYVDIPLKKRQFGTFSFWKSSKYPFLIFFSSNYSDGRFTLCNVIHNKTGCAYVLCRMHNGKGDYMPGCMFHYVDENTQERHILAYKAPKWVFYQQGTPLPFEDTSLYNSRFIKKRLNTKIIITYLYKLGIDFKEIDTDISDSFTCILNT